jgi:hypothetical protein
MIVVDVGIRGRSGYTCLVDDVADEAHQNSMATEAESSTKPVHLSEDEVAYLLSILRSSTQVQPISTQELIDALRNRATQ